MTAEHELWTRVASRDPRAIEQLFACEQGVEILARVRRIAARLYPPRPCPHGFYEFPAFIERARERDRERAVIRDVHARLAEKVRARDAGSTIEEKVRRIAARKRSV